MTLKKEEIVLTIHKTPFEARARVELAGIIRTTKSLQRDYAIDVRKFHAGKISVVLRTRFYNCNLFNDSGELERFLRLYARPYARKKKLTIISGVGQKTIHHKDGPPSIVDINDVWQLGITIN